MKNLVFIFSIWAIATLTKSADYRESAIVVNSEVFQTQIYTPILSFSNLIFEISADDYNGLTEKKDIDSEVKKTETVVFRLITEIGKKQNKLQPLIYDLPPPDKA